MKYHLLSQVDAEKGNTCKNQGARFINSNRYETLVMNVPVGKLSNIFAGKMASVSLEMTG